MKEEITLSPTIGWACYSQSSKFADGPGPTLIQFSGNMTVEHAFAIIKAAGYKSASKEKARKTWRGIKGRYGAKAILILNDEDPENPLLTIYQKTTGAHIEEIGAGFVPTGAFFPVEPV